MRHVEPSEPAAGEQKVPHTVDEDWAVQKARELLSRHFLMFGKPTALEEDIMQEFRKVKEAALVEEWKEIRSWKPFLHFCPEWDCLLIDKGDPEFESCVCFKQEKKDV